MITNVQYHDHYLNVKLKKKSRRDDLVFNRAISSHSLFSYDQDIRTVDSASDWLMAYGRTEHETENAF